MNQKEAKNMKTSEKFEMLFCDPEGKVSIDGSERDKEILQQAIKETSLLEKYLESLREIIRSDNEVFLKFPPNIKKDVKEKILFCFNIFGDFPEKEV